MMIMFLVKMMMISHLVERGDVFVYVYKNDEDEDDDDDDGDDDDDDNLPR